MTAHAGNLGTIRDTSRTDPKPVGSIRAANMASILRRGASRASSARSYTRTNPSARNSARQRSCSGIAASVRRCEPFPVIADLLALQIHRAGKG